jgi:hypothetical protein
MELVSSRRTATFIVTLVVTAFFIFLFDKTLDFPKPMIAGYQGDAFFPRLILGFGLIWSVALIFLSRPGVAIDAISDDAREVRLAILPFLGICAGVVIYVAVLETVGFEICTFVFMFVLLVTRFRGSLQKRIMLSAVTALITTAVSYVCFVVLLNVSFPMHFLPSYF